MFVCHIDWNESRHFIGSSHGQGNIVFGRHPSHGFTHLSDMFRLGTAATAYDVRTLKYEFAGIIGHVFGGADIDETSFVDSGQAEFREQSEEGASHQGLVNDEVARIDWSRPAVEVDRLIRGCDPQPGAWAECDGEAVRLFDARLGRSAQGKAGEVLGLEEGRLEVACADGSISVGKLRLGDAKKGPAAEAGLASGARLQ